MERRGRDDSGVCHMCNGDHLDPWLPSHHMDNAMSPECKALYLLADKLEQDCKYPTSQVCRQAATRMELMEGIILENLLRAVERERSGE